MKGRDEGEKNDGMPKFGKILKKHQRGEGGRKETCLSGNMRYSSKKQKNSAYYVHIKSIVSFSTGGVHIIFYLYHSSPPHPPSPLSFTRSSNEKKLCLRIYMFPLEKS